MSKTIVITGTSTGFGNIIAKTLSNEGHGVIATMQEIYGKNKMAARELRSIPNIEVVDLDVTSDRSVDDCIAYIFHKYGTIDVLINNAGVMGMGLLEATSTDQIKKMLEINLFGAIRLYQAVLPGMRKNKCGALLNISCELAGHQAPFMVPYAISKMGLELLTKGTREELKGQGIECISVVVGGITTGILNKEWLNADRPRISDVYDRVCHERLQTLKSQLFNMASPDDRMAREVAAGILEVLQMKKGTRPEQYFIGTHQGTTPNE